MRKAAMAVGVLAALAGSIWFLQGINLLGGSRMTGDPFWAQAGAITAVVGIAVAGVAWRVGSRVAVKP